MPTCSPPGPVRRTSTTARRSRHPDRDLYPTTGTAPAFKAYDYYAEAYAESKDGHVLIARVATGVHVRGADCTFSGLFLDDHSKTPLSPVVGGGGRGYEDAVQRRFFRVEGTCSTTAAGTSAPRRRSRQGRTTRSATTATPHADLDFDQADGAVVFNSGGPTGTMPEFEAFDYSNEVVAVSDIPPGADRPRRERCPRARAGLLLLGALPRLGGRRRQAVHAEQGAPEDEPVQGHRDVRRQRRRRLHRAGYRSRPRRTVRSTSSRTPGPRSGSISPTDRSRSTTYRRPARARRSGPRTTVRRSTPRAWARTSSSRGRSAACTSSAAMHVRRAFPVVAAGQSSPSQ